MTAQLGVLRRRSPRVMFASLSCAGALAVRLGVPAPSALAAEVIVQNDSATTGASATPCNCFIPGERVAAWLTAPVTGNIVGVRIFWKSAVGGAPSSLETAITLSAAAAFPTPGAVLQNSGAMSAIVVGPTLNDGVFNEFRFLDPPTNSIPMSIPVSVGTGFVVDLELQNQTSGQGPFGPDVAWDADGCQANKNAVFVMPGGWNDACALGVAGDWVIRVIVAQATTTTTSSTTTTSTTLPSLGCAATPELACLTTAGAKVDYNETKAGKEKMKLQWKKVGSLTAQGSFGDPVNGQTGVAVCIYDDGGNLVKDFIVERAGASCAGKPCWKTQGTKGYAYKDKESSADGIAKIGFKAGDAGKGQADAQGKNNAGKGQASLPTGVVAGLTGNTAPTVQMVTSDGFCVTATMNEVKKDDGTRYAAQLK